MSGTKRKKMDVHAWEQDFGRDPVLRRILNAGGDPEDAMHAAAAVRHLKALVGGGKLDDSLTKLEEAITELAVVAKEAVTAERATQDAAGKALRANDLKLKAEKDKTQRAQTAEQAAQAEAETLREANVKAEQAAQAAQAEAETLREANVKAEQAAQAAQAEAETLMEAKVKAEEQFTKLKEEKRKVDTEVESVTDRIEKTTSKVREQLGGQQFQQSPARKSGGAGGAGGGGEGVKLTSNVLKGH